MTKVTFHKKVRTEYLVVFHDLDTSRTVSPELAELMVRDLEADGFTRVNSENPFNENNDSMNGDYTYER